MVVLLSGKNPYAGYMDKFKVEHGKDPNPVHEVVNTYFQIIGKDKMSKSFYQGRYSYGRLATQAKRLLENCDGQLEDAMWALDRMNYMAEKGKFDWTISTCLKHKLR